MRVEEHLEQFTRRDWQERTTGGPVRFAVVGLGDFALERGLPALEQTERCELTTVVSGSPEKATSAAEEFDAGHALDYDSFVDGTAADAYDAVYVATPPAFHREYTRAAAEQGKHVLCEKPLATDVESAREMVRACEEAGVVLMTAYRLQTEPAIRRSRELIVDGCIGEPVQAYGEFSVRILDAAGPDSWRLDPDVAGGGALIDLGIYPLNTLRFLLQADPLAVWGETRSTHEAFDDVEENVAFHLSFPDDVLTSCTASFNAYKTSQLQVLGTEGRIRINTPFGGEVPQHILVECGDVTTEYTGEPIDEVVEQFAYFAHCIVTGESPEPDGNDGLADLDVIEATYAAAETSCSVDIEYSVV